MAQMLGIANMVLGFLILWLGIKFLAEPIGDTDDPGWLRSFLMAVLIWFISWFVLAGFNSLFTG